jgi:MOSC domain-containing protein YiiM
MGKIVSINISKKKRVWKKPIEKGELVAGMGLRGDAHAGPGERQISLLMMESIQKQIDLLGQGTPAASEPDKNRKQIELKPGVYAENLTTSGINLLALKPGDELSVGHKIKLRVTRIGKECHTNCAIYQIIGDCVMPREGIFCEVLEGGTVRHGDEIERC